MRHSFDQIKQQQNLKTVKFNKGCDRAAKILLNLMIRKEKIMLLRYLNKFRSTVKSDNQKVKIFKTIFNNMWSHLVRDVFNKWRTQANLIETFEYNQEFGPIRMEVNEYRRISKNLKGLLEKDGFNKKEI